MHDEAHEEYRFPSTQAVWLWIEEIVRHEFEPGPKTGWQGLLARCECFGIILDDESEVWIGFSDGATDMAPTAADIHNGRGSKTRPVEGVEDMGAVEDATRDAERVHGQAEAFGSLGFDLLEVFEHGQVGLVCELEA